MSIFCIQYPVFCRLTLTLYYYQVLLFGFHRYKIVGVIGGAYLILFCSLIPLFCWSILLNSVSLFFMMLFYR